MEHSNNDFSFDNTNTHDSGDDKDDVDAPGGSLNDDEDP